MAALCLVVAACGPDGGLGDPSSGSDEPLLEVSGGMVVLRVEPGSQADQVGIEVGEVIAAYDGRSVVSGADLKEAMAQVEDGTKVVVGLVGFSGRREVTVQAGRLGCGLDEIGAGAGDAAFNAACALALEGRPERARVLLERAIHDGYHDVEWLSTDDDLRSLRQQAFWPSIVDRCRAAQDEYLGSINSELYALYQADQKDRSGQIPVDGWNEVAERDRDRRDRVDSMISAGELHVADDYFHAAMIFQHGDKPEHYARAHELAMQAVELGATVVPARWLAAAAKDRHLLSLGEKQWYGTQFLVRDGVWELQPVDENAVSDDERRAMDVPTLADTIAGLERRSQAAANS